MRLTEQQRYELERHGFVVLDGDVLADPASGRVFSIDGAIPRAAEAAAILGIAPAGYRLVPEEVAEKAVQAIDDMMLLANEAGLAPQPGALERIMSAREALSRLQQNGGARR